MLFRSEEHVQRWCREKNLPMGAAFELERGWRLAYSWYRDRLDPDWRRKTPEEVLSLFQSLGFDSEFWSLD